MILPDVNILVCAFDADSPLHEQCFNWVQHVITGPERYCISPQVLSSVMRIVTNHKIFKVPATTERALEFCESLINPRCELVRPGARHWGIFTRLCRESGATGNLIPDAWLAALAIEHGCEWVSSDTDFGLFPGLRWRKPF